MNCFCLLLLAGFGSGVSAKNRERKDVVKEKGFVKIYVLFHISPEFRIIVI